MHFSCFFSFLIKFTGFYLYRNTLLTSPLSSTHTLSFWIHRWPASHQPPSSTPSAPSSSPHLATCPDNVSVVCFPASNKRVRRRHPRSLRPAPCSKKKKKTLFKINRCAVCLWGQLSSGACLYKHLLGVNEGQRGPEDTILFSPFSKTKTTSGHMLCSISRPA